MAKKQTLVTFVLDETGSMQSIKDDTIGGFNAYLDTLKDSKENIRFSLLKFDSNRTEKVCVDSPIAEVAPLTSETYRPGAMTPLIDACCKAIHATAEKVKGKKKPNVAIVIQTDGHENASVEYSRDDLAALVKEKTAAGWAFTFLGAGIDAFAQAGQFGFTAANTMSYDRDKSGATFEAMAASNLRYAATGMAESAAFTAAERAAVGDKKVKNVTAAAKRVQRSGRKIVDDITL